MEKEKIVIVLSYLFFPTNPFIEWVHVVVVGAPLPPLRGVIFWLYVLLFVYLKEGRKAHDGDA